MARERARSTVAVATAAAVIVVAGCARSGTTTSEALTGVTEVPMAVETSAPPTTVEPTIPSTTAETTTVPPTSAPATTAPTTTQPATTTTASPTTSTTPLLTVADLTLARNGILPVTFGTDAAVAVARLGEALGPAASGDVALYPNDTGDAYLDEFEETEYTWPIGRTVCWPGLCVELGGTTTDTLQMTGWSHFGDGVPGLKAADGLTIGSTQTAFEMTVYPGGCYSVGYGEQDGIALTLRSTGDPFVLVTDDGTWVEQTPDPADVEVVAMQAGDRPVFVFADC